LYFKHLVVIHFHVIQANNGKIPKNANKVSIQRVGHSAIFSDARKIKNAKITCTILTCLLFIKHKLVNHIIIGIIHRDT
jgi:hypothetical protein